jgi:hypothetical protein
MSPFLPEHYSETYFPGLFMGRERLENDNYYYNKH